MSDAPREISYDQVPYPSLSYTQSHPDRLATLATLLGMHPAPPERCRVLELGCAGGGNLIPMAYGLPESTFVGIDYAVAQVIEGQQMVEALRLANVTLQHLDIMDVGAELGRFDYIIAHGVFSWVPHPVQEKLLATCKDNLAPQGVAYVSYNAYPGWHMLEIIRDMMLYHTRQIADPQERAGEARSLLDFLAGSVPAENSAYGSFLSTYVQMLRGELKGAHDRGDAFLLHDELEEVNEPIYFYQFAERAEARGLQYLGEAEFRTMVDSNYPPQVSQKLREMSRSAVELEQYMDFLRNRTFRQTLLCHRDVPLSHTLRPDQVQAFYISSRAQPTEAEVDIAAQTVVRFRASDGAVLSTDHPLSKAAMLCLADAWPRALSFEELLSMAQSRLGLPEKEVQGIDEGSPSEEALVLGTNLLRAFTYSGNLIGLHAYAPRLVLDLSERPLASPVARWQARGSERVTNLRHERVRLEPVERLLLLCLDGEHDLAALVERLREGPVAEGALAVQQDGESIADPAQVDQILARGVKRCLSSLARAALLVG